MRKLKRLCQKVRLSTVRSDTDKFILLPRNYCQRIAASNAILQSRAFSQRWSENYLSSRSRCAIAAEFHVIQLNSFDSCMSSTKTEPSKRTLRAFRPRRIAAKTHPDDFRILSLLLQSENIMSSWAMIAKCLAMLRWFCALAFRNVKDKIIVMSFLQRIQLRRTQRSFWFKRLFFCTINEVLAYVNWKRRASWCTNPTCTRRNDCISCRVNSVNYR